MSKLDSLKLLLKEYNGVINTKQAEENNVHRQYLNIMICEGNLESVAHGIYITPDS